MYHCKPYGKMIFVNKTERLEDSQTFSVDSFSQDENYKKRSIWNYKTVNLRMKVNDSQYFHFNSLISRFHGTLISLSYYLILLPQSHLLSLRERY